MVHAFFHVATYVCENCLQCHDGPDQLWEAERSPQWPPSPPLAEGCASLSTAVWLCVRAAPAEASRGVVGLGAEPHMGTEQQPTHSLGG